MAAALDAVDFLAICLLVVALALTVLALKVSQAVASAIDIDIPIVGHPFHFVAATINNHLVPALNDVVQAESSAIHTLWAGLTWSLRLVATGLRDLANGTDLMIQHAWSQLHDTFQASYAWAHHELARVDAAAAALARKLAADVNRLELLAHQLADSALQHATGYTDAAIATLHRTVTHDIAAARDAAEHYADAQVSHVEHTVAGVERELGNVEGEVAGVIRGIPGDVVAELDALARATGATDIASLLKAIPVTAAALVALEVATGLDSAGCRSKVKGICGVDPLQWANLLAGLAALDFALSLRAIAGPARELTHELGAAFHEFA